MCLAKVYKTLLLLIDKRMGLLSHSLNYMFMCFSAIWFPYPLIHCNSYYVYKNLKSFQIQIFLNWKSLQYFVLFPFSLFTFYFLLYIFATRPILIFFFTRAAHIAFVNKKKIKSNVWPKSSYIYNKDFCAPDRIDIRYMNKDICVK